MIQSDVIARGGFGNLLRRALVSATVAGWIAILGRVVGVAIVIPIAFRTLAAPDTVLWLFFTTAINFQAILDFGHNTTFGRFIAYARASNRNKGADAANQIVSAGPPLQTLLTIIGPAYLRMTAGMVAIAVPLLSYMARAPIAASSHPTMHWLVWLAVCTSLAVQTYGGRFIAVLQGFERVAVQRWIEAGMGVATNVAAGLFLWYSGGLAAAAVATAIVGIGGSLAYGIASHKFVFAMKLPVVRIKEGELVRAREEIWHAAWRSGVGIWCSTGLIQLLSMTVSNIAPAANAASFMFAMRIAQVISALSQSPFYNHLPTLARKFREHDLDAVRSEARSRMLSATLIIACGFTTVGMIGPYVLARLGSKTNFVEAAIWLAMGCGFLTERVGAMHMQLFTLGGRVIWHWVNGLTGGSMLIFTYLSYRSIGLIAIPTSMCIAYVGIYCSISISKSYKLLNLRFSTFDLIATFPAVVVLSAYAIVQLPFSR